MPFMTLMEPFRTRTRIDNYKRWLGYHSAYSNCNNKIWLLWDHTFECAIIQDTMQLVINYFIDCEDILMITIIYAKCKKHPGEPLWDEHRNITKISIFPR